MLRYKMNTGIYIYRIEKEYIEAHLDELIAALPEWRRKKAEKLRRTESKVVSVAAGSLLYHVLDKEYGISAEGLDIKEGPSGKPESDKVFFNISHSGEYIALAVSDKKIGIDIEYKDDRGGRVAKRFFTEEERRYIQGNDGNCGEERDGSDEQKDRDGSIYSEQDIIKWSDIEVQKRFRKIWTMKESTIKLLGAGLSIPLKKIPVDPIGDTVDISALPEFGMNKAQFLCYEFEGDDKTDYSVAVCAENIQKNTVKYIQYYGCIFSE